MAYLIDKEHVLEAIDEVKDLRGATYCEVVDAINELPIIAVEKDCRGCFGAGFEDCEKCERFKFASVRVEIRDRLSGIVETIDRGLEEYIEVLNEWVEHFKNRERKHFKRNKLCEKIKRIMR